MTYHNIMLQVSQTGRFTVRNVMVWASSIQKGLCLANWPSSMLGIRITLQKTHGRCRHSASASSRVSLAFIKHAVGQSIRSDQTSTADGWCDVTLAPFSAAIGPTPIYLT